MSHQSEVSGGEPLFDSEGLQVVGLRTDYEVRCSCGWNAKAETVDQALELKYKHEATSDE